MKTRIKETIKKGGSKVYNAQCKYNPKQVWGWYNPYFTNWHSSYSFFLIPIIGQVTLVCILALILVSYFIEILLWHDIVYYRVSYDNEIERYSTNYNNIDAAKQRIDEFIENDSNVNMLEQCKKIILENKLHKKNNKCKKINYIKYP